MVGPPRDDVRPILVVLSAEQFCISHRQVMIAFELTLLDAALCHGINTRTWERRGLVDLVTKRFICMYDHAVPWVHSLQLCKPFVQCLM